MFRGRVLQRKSRPRKTAQNNTNLNMNNTKFSFCEQLACDSRDDEIDRLLLALKDPEPPALGFDAVLAGVTLRAGIDTLALVARIPGCRLSDRASYTLKGSRVDYRRLDDDGMWSVTLQDVSRASLVALDRQLRGWGSVSSPDVSGLHVCLDARPAAGIERLDALALLRDFWSSPIAGAWRQAFERTWYFGDYQRGSEPDFQAICYDKVLNDGEDLEASDQRARFEIRFTQAGLAQAGIGRIKTLDDLLRGVDFRRTFGEWFRYRKCQDSPMPVVAEGKGKAVASVAHAKLRNRVADALDKLTDRLCDA
jgi:hypothetical protein